MLPASCFEEEFGFAITCYYSGAINFDELKEWCFLKIEKDSSNLPSYIFECCTAVDISDMRKILGFNNYSRLTCSLNNGEHRALYGIAYKRGFYSKDNPCELCTEKTALKNLENNPHILERFKQTFPFIKLEWAE